MTVTSITNVAVSFRTVTEDPPHASAPAHKDAPAPPATDSVELSQQAAAEARSTDPSARAETLLKAFDTDGDGVVTKTEFTTGAMEVLKRASVRFHHQHVGRGGGVDKRDQRWTDHLEEVFAKVDANHDGAIDRAELTSALPARQVTAASLAIREYTIVSRAKKAPPA
jgi:hypothetical protein